MQWNLGKFLVDAAREPVARFRSAVAPEDPALVTAIGALLPHWGAAPDIDGDPRNKGVDYAMSVNDRFLFLNIHVA